MNGNLGRVSWLRLHSLRVTTCSQCSGTKTGVTWSGVCTGELIPISGSLVGLGYLFVCMKYLV